MIEGVRDCLKKGSRVEVHNKTRNRSFQTEHSLSQRQVQIVLAGSLISVVREELGSPV